MNSRDQNIITRGSEAQHGKIDWIPVPGKANFFLGIGYYKNLVYDFTWLLMCRFVPDKQEPYTFSIFSSGSREEVGAKLYEELKQNRQEDESRTRHRKLKARWARF